MSADDNALSHRGVAHLRRPSLRDIGALQLLGNDEPVELSATINFPLPGFIRRYH